MFGSHGREHGNSGRGIVLLALAPNGRLIVWDRLRFALAGSELVRLAAAGRIDLVDGRIEVLAAAESDPGDEMLRVALDSIRRAEAAPRVEAWVSGRGQGIVDAYLASLDAAGVIRTERRRMLGLTLATRWYVSDSERQRLARARLDEIAQDGGIDENGEALCTPEQAALGGLVGAIGLGAELYPGPEGAAARERLVAVGRFDGMPGVAAQVAGAAALQAIREAVDAAMHITIDAAIHAAEAATAHHAAHSVTVSGGHH
ncbi:GOLPH3/VPS74 family protein [Actinospica robiniae]|uniref:GOLPH3/VPS74 family protein n=1 Tax=Actinospica robiniae TaxID=304901 RepID=UPI000404E267|nr:GPP34 family phosphoprotein [Actinospica robiniae]